MTEEKKEVQKEEAKKSEEKQEHKVHVVHQVHKAKKDNLWKIISGILFVLLLASLLMNPFSSRGKELSGQDASQRAITFLNENLLQGGVVAKATGVEEAKGYELYKIKLDVGGREYDSYVTKDGRFLFPTAVDTTEKIEAPAAQPQQPEEIPKTDKPAIGIYVMSFCPFGNQAEDTMLPVYNLFKDKVDWKVHYIVSVSGDTVRSLHGQPETNQNIREVCVKRDYGMDAFWKFMTYVNKNCGSDGSCWEEAAKQAGADSKKIQACFDKDGLSLMKAEGAATDAAGASGSPTLLINGVQSKSVYQYGNSEAYKAAICSAFTNPPAECQQALGTQTATTQGGSCG